MVLGWAPGRTVSDQGTIWATSIHVACRGQEPILP